MHSEDNIEELEFPDEMKQIMDHLDLLAVTDRDKEECFSICLMLMFDPDDPDDPTLTEEDFFNFPLIRQTLKFAKDAKTVREVSDFVWDRIEKIDPDYN